MKVFGRHREVEARFAEKNEELFKASFGAQFISGIIMPATNFVGNLVYVAIAVVGGVLVAGGLDEDRRRAGLHPVLASVHPAARPAREPRQPAAVGRRECRAGVRAARCRRAVGRSRRRRIAARVGGQATAGRLAFEHASFRYDPEKPLIDDLSLVAEPGSTVAIVGPTGAGKTTLVNLIMRFYDLDGGRITLDGVDIATMTRDDLRSRTGMVLQDTWLFKGTIRDNIAYGRPEATEDEILEAAQDAYVDRFVHALPDGYDTVLDDEGGNVSAGEKQLITIARAFLARPEVLILDEATSSVDTRTELLVQRAMRELRRSRTSFVIAHRLSTIRDADLILVMEAGLDRREGHPRAAHRRRRRLRPALRGAVRGPGRTRRGGCARGLGAACALQSCTRGRIAGRASNSAARKVARDGKRRTSYPTLGLHDRRTAESPGCRRTSGAFLRGIRPAWTS